MKKVVVSLLVIILVAAVGAGGWYLWDSLQKEKNKTGELENRIANIEEVEKEKNDRVNSSAKVKDYSTSDAIISNNLKLGMKENDVISIIGEPNDSQLVYEDATGDNVKISKYTSLGLTIEYRGAEDSNRISQMSWNNSNLKTARGITVGSTEKDVFSAYPEESILLKDESNPNVDRVIVIVSSMKPLTPGAWASSPATITNILKPIGKRI